MSFISSHRGVNGVCTENQLLGDWGERGKRKVQSWQVERDRGSQSKYLVPAAERGASACIFPKPGERGMCVYVCWQTSN